MQKKKRESAKKNQGGQQSLKELRFGLHIDSGDLATKMKQAKGFLEKGHRVRIFMQLKGADFHRNQALALKRLDEIAQLIGDAGTQDSKPALSGNHVSTTLVPKPQKNTSHRDSRREE
jgi:translation initiation factor IF-3